VAAIIRDQKIRQIFNTPWEIAGRLTYGRDRLVGVWVSGGTSG